MDTEHITKNQSAKGSGMVGANSSTVNDSDYGDMSWANKAGSNPVSNTVNTKLYDPFNFDDDDGQGEDDEEEKLDPIESSGRKQLREDYFDLKAKIMNQSQNLLERLRSSFND